MKPITCIFFGKSGSGKGTQVELLLKYIAEKDPKTKALKLETGACFREFSKTSTSYTAAKMKEVLGSGGLMPAFLPIWAWSAFMIEKISGAGNEHLIMDGVSRRPDEAPILDSALQFYERKDTIIFLVEVSREETKRRLLARGRHDDKDEEINKRLDWFETDVIKAVEFFEKNPFYKFVRINGDQSVEDVHKDIIKTLGI